jgi:hypothetical protein
MKFISPTLPTYSHGKLDILEEADGLNLYFDGERQMTTGYNHNSQFFEVYSHSHVAHGHVIGTGLGFLFRELMLLENPHVTKITILEKCEELIQYHLKFNCGIMDQIEVIHCDADTFEGKCDTFLMDHVEHGDHLGRFKNCLNNIQCTTSWFWPIELYCVNYDEYSSLRNKISTLPNLQRLEYELLVETFERDRVWVSVPKEDYERFSSVTI